MNPEMHTDQLPLAIIAAGAWLLWLVQSWKRGRRG